MTNKHNSGDYNSGSRNSGYYNSGYHNSGDYNSGYYNSGYYNSGNHNSGYYNSGYYNSGNHNSGDCNTTNPTVRMFNKDSSLEFLGEIHSNFRRIIYKYQKPLCEWVSEFNMDNDEKIQTPSYKTTGGYLKVNTSTYNGLDISEEDIEFLKSLPNFDSEILLETTGIDITNKKKKIVIDGKEIFISKESFDDIKKQFME